MASYGARPNRRPRIFCMAALSACPALLKVKPRGHTPSAAVTRRVALSRTQRHARNQRAQDQALNLSPTPRRASFSHFCLPLVPTSAACTLFADPEARSSSASIGRNSRLTTCWNIDGSKFRLQQQRSKHPVNLTFHN